MYLYGSLITGDFDRGSSDIDLLAALSEPIDDAEFARLNDLHDALAASFPEWAGRVEVYYASLAALKTFRTQTSVIAAISPGEPFHRKEAGRAYLLNWWIVREKGLTLFGPPPQDLIDPISREEFVAVVREHAASWKGWLDDQSHRPGQAYAILTMCRALYAVTYGEQVSKKRAAKWVQTIMPEWKWLIEAALQWRADWRTDVPDPLATIPDTRKFVYQAVDRILDRVV
jgi:hypothetical protein